MAWAMVTEAGMPYLCWAAIAPGATSLMNACWAAVPGVLVGGGLCLPLAGACWPPGPPPVVSASTCDPGMAALPAAAGAWRPGPSDATPGTWAASPAACEPPVACEPPAADWPSWPAVLTSSPLLTNPSTPWAVSGAGNLCALTVRFGSESPPTVYRAAPVYLVTTSTCPSNSTQSPGCGW